MASGKIFVGEEILAVITFEILLDEEAIKIWVTITATAFMSRPKID